MKNRYLIIAALIAANLASATPAWANASSKDFIHKASIGGQFEISSSRFALTNSQNDNVKNLAQELIDDHKRIADQMNSVLQLSEPDKVQTTPNVDLDHQKMLDQLNDARGRDFDKLYVNDQAKAHKEAINLFKKYAKDGSNEELKAFAEQTVPMLQKHLDDVKRLQKSM